MRNNFRVASPAPNAPLAPPPVAATPAARMVQLPSGVTVPIRDTIRLVMGDKAATQQLGLTSDLSLVTVSDTPLYVSKAQGNSNLITAAIDTMTYTDCMGSYTKDIYEKPWDLELSLAYTNTDAVPDLADPLVAFQSLPEHPPDETFVLADSPPTDTNNWVSHSFWIDGCASCSVTSNPVFIHSGRTGDCADSTEGFAGSAIPERVGLLTMRILESPVTFEGSKCLSGFTSIDLLSEGHLNELNYYVDRKNNSLECPSGELVPLTPDGPHNRFMRLDTWVYKYICWTGTTLSL